MLQDEADARIMNYDDGDYGGVVSVVLVIRIILVISMMVMVMMLGMEIRMKAIH